MDSQKQKIRKTVKDRFSGRNPNESKAASRDIMARVEKLPQFMESKTVALYWSAGNEVATHEFVEKWSTGKTILLPVVAGDDLVLKKFSCAEDMRCGCFGIEEPQCEEFPAEDYDRIGLIVVPGVAFDRKGHRLGRGKGFYDRLLPRIKGYKAGVCFDFQMFPEIPAEPHDATVDRVISG